METNVNYTIVGAFVIAMIAAIVLGIIWLSSGLSTSESNVYYLVYMQESVTGLTVDAPVEYNGVSVGAVKSIELNQKNPHLVELLLSIKKTTPITRGTVATLATRGITGITFIALKDVSRDLTPLVADPGQKYPVIKTAPSLFVRLDAFLNQLSTSFRQMSTSMQALLTKENLESVRATLENLKEVTGTLSANSKRLDAILLNTSKASQQFGPLMQSSASTMRILEMQTLPAAYRVLSNLDEVSRTLTDVSAQLKQNPSVIIRGATPPPLGPGESK